MAKATHRCPHAWGKPDGRHYRHCHKCKGSQVFTVDAFPPGNFSKAADAVGIDAERAWSIRRGDEVRYGGKHFEDSDFPPHWFGQMLPDPADVVAVRAAWAVWNDALAGQKIPPTPDNPEPPRTPRPKPRRVEAEWSLLLTASQNRVFPAKRATSAALQPPLIPRRRSRASIQRWRSLSPPRARSASV